MYKVHAFVSPVLSLLQKHRERTHRSLSLTQTVLGHEVSSHQCSTILTWLTLCFPTMAFEASHRKEMLRCCALHLYSVSICFYLPHDWPMQLGHLRKSTWSVCSTANKYSIRKKELPGIVEFWWNSFHLFIINSVWTISTTDQPNSHVKFSSTLVSIEETPLDFTLFKFLSLFVALFSFLLKKKNYILKMSQMSSIRIWIKYLHNSHPNFPYKYAHGI